jgi:uncharacterized radical SAM superfamily Fe-S cluster-containing enzyme
MMQYRDHTFLGVTQSLCPQCLRLVPAKILNRAGRIYFRKTCPEHGVRDDFICSDATYFDRLEFVVPGRIPPQVGVETNRGCPFDCGLCTEHEQHTCVGLVEVTSACNLKCPMCYANSGPGGKHLSLEECCRAIDRLVEVEGRPEVLQLSGGEPTLHPEFLQILDYAYRQPIDVIMINTNGVRLAHDGPFVDALTAYRDRLEIYLQFDGFRERDTERLRGEPLVGIKLAAVEALGKAAIRATLVTTLQGGVNLDEVGPIVRFGLERSWISGVSFQPATYSGRYWLPEQLEQRITFPDVVQAIVEQTDGMFQRDDFMPLACAHPNCHTLTYAFRRRGQVVPLPRFIDVPNNLDLLSGGIAFTRPKARQLIERYLGSQGCCNGQCGPPEPVLGGMGLPVVEIGGTAGECCPDNSLESLAQEFFADGQQELLRSADVFRITITSFLDAYNFDVRRVMQCCIHHVLPSGHVIPFCAYNVLYREGHVSLPMLDRMATELAQS